MISNILKYLLFLFIIILTVEYFHLKVKFRPVILILTKKRPPS